MPIIKYEPTFAELVDNAAQRRVEEVERWNQTIYLIYGSKIDPFSSFLRKLGGDIEPNKVIEGDVEVKPSILLKISAVAYLFVNGPFSYPRSIVICFMLLTLVFRLADATLQERTASLSYYLDTIINIIFIIEGFLRLLTLPVTLETRKNNKEQIRSLTYEILRCGWIEIILSIGSLILIRKLNSSNAICWINYFRMTFISKFFLSESPQVEVILSGIVSGLRSVISTWFLLMVCFVVYGVLTTSFFRANDPAHFSTVGTAMFTLFRISTMDDWSVVLYINAYGCDAVPSEYIPIEPDDPTPRYVDVIAGRMYLYYCDSPAAFPYASSLIFTSFTVITGFILISLTVAAVSAGVKRRLQEIQSYNEEKRRLALEKQQAAEAMEIVDKLKSDSEEYYKSSSCESNTVVAREPEVQMPSRLRPVIGKSLSLLRALNFMRSSNAIVPEEECEGTTHVKKPKESTIKKATSSFKGIPLLQNKPLIRQICKQMWNDVDTTRKKRKELKEELEKESMIEGLDGEGKEGETSVSVRRASIMVGNARRGSVAAGARRVSVVGARRKSSFKAVATAFQLTHQYQAVSILRSSREMGPVNSSLQGTPGTSFHGGGRQSSISALLKEYNFEEILSSKENVLLFIRNSLASPFYIGYLISLIITIAGCQIYCVNKDNCANFWPIFLVIQILLTLDILIRILTAYPTYFDYFDNKRNLFDCFIVAIIWIPIFYRSGYGFVIAGTVRIVYLLRLFPLLSWITDLQVLFLAIRSSIRPLFYVICIMFIMFFQFAVAGVLIFKKNDEFYFGTLYRAMNTLFQLCTLDTWGTVALKNMYGCDQYPPQGLGGDDDGSMCEHPLGLGWIAAWYFIIFVTLSMMILHSLFVGIIISARELLKDSVFREAKMWKLVYLRVKKYGLQNSTLMNLLEIFNACDVEKNGLLSKKELSVILKYLPSIDFRTVIKQIGVDSSGQLNFAEFIDLIHFIGVRGKVYRHSHPTTTLDLKTLRAQSKLNLEADGENNSNSPSITSLASVATNIVQFRSFTEVNQFEVRKEEQTTKI